MLYDRGISSLPPEYKQPIRFVQIATFTRKKGQDIFIQAASRQKDTNFTIDFYGEIADPIYYQNCCNWRKKILIFVSDFIRSSVCRIILKLCSHHILQSILAEQLNQRYRGRMPSIY